MLGFHTLLDVSLEAVITLLQEGRLACVVRVARCSSPIPTTPLKTRMSAPKRSTRLCSNPKSILVREVTGEETTPDHTTDHHQLDLQS
eukprot:1184428-Prorocentrum_minimum.AAC.1